MPKKESKGESGKRAAWCALCAVGIYLALQVLGALLVSREVVGEDQAQLLVAASAALAALIGVLVIGRGCRTGRMLLGAAGAGGLILVMLTGTLAAGGFAGGAGGRLAAAAAAAAAGGTFAAAAAGPKRKRQNRRRRGRGKE